MKPIQRVAIVGLGLMGGSLARALAGRDVHVLGFDRVPDSLDAALGEGIVHERLSARLNGIESADVVVFALPVDATIALIGSSAALLGGVPLVMDVASTKRTIVETAEAMGLGERYVGAHPLTGSHRSGWRASRATLFDEARVFLCPTRDTLRETLEMAEGFWRALRAGVEVLDAATHDVEMAWRSHLPQVVSTALALTLRDAGIKRSALGPGGRDVTRLAGSAPEMWAAIVEDNVEALTTALDALEEQIRFFRGALQERERGATHNLFGNARAWFDGEPVA